MAADIVALGASHWKTYMLISDVGTYSGPVTVALREKHEVDAAPTADGLQVSAIKLSAEAVP
jgi:hypothetical protein